MIPKIWTWVMSITIWCELDGEVVIAEANKVLRGEEVEGPVNSVTIGVKRSLGGFAAALDSQKSWVMNVVPIIAENTLGVVYERGLIGIYHDWYVPKNSQSCNLKWTLNENVAKMVDHEDGSLVPEKILVAVKEYWVATTNKSSSN
ncbi:hypothetical protein ACSQ67_025583 [Phaseolus vulgaris]